jgi:hypothetical protein
MAGLGQGRRVFIKKSLVPIDVSNRDYRGGGGGLVPVEETNQD